MAKNAVFPYVMFTRFVDEPMLKRLALFFENICISEARLDQILKTDVINLREDLRQLAYEKAVWEFLLEKNIVKTYPFNLDKHKTIEEGSEKAQLYQKLAKLIPFRKETEKGSNIVNSQLSDAELQESKIKALESFFTSHDISVRLDAIDLGEDTTSEHYPILRTNLSFNQQEKKSSVIQFLMNDIPEPDPVTAWEQIVDFRTDPDVKNKYLALINWVNKMAVSSASVSDICDEYEYLYSDYIKHFKLHKLKYNNTMLEVIVTAGAGVLMALQAGEFISSFKNLLQMNLSHITLMQEESKLPGKEVAYIYHLKKQFQK